MKSKLPRIGICCIGSGVGQSVISSCCLSKLPMTTIGIGNNPLAYGLYDCDEYVITKSFYDKDYIDQLLVVCSEKSIDLLIPGHDNEAHLFAHEIDRFRSNGVDVLVSSQEILDICRDKELMSTRLDKNMETFVRTYSKSGFEEAFNNGDISLPMIAKPRKGFASRGIEIILEESDLSRINDDHIVQELAIPNSRDPSHEYYLKGIAEGVNPQISEISVQLVTRKDGSEMGRMATCNKLSNGVPIEILPIDDPVIWDSIDNLIPTFVSLGMRGPLNLQGRLTDEGFRIFEMNARFTGITGIRALMGFNEVDACLRHWLYEENSITLQANNRMVGIRQVADRVVPVDKIPG